MRNGYLPGMGLADIAAQDENSPVLTDGEDTFDLEMTPPAMHRDIHVPQVTSQPASAEIGIMSMLQKQQGVLDQVLQGQRKLEEHQERLEQRLECLEEQVSQPTSSNDNCSGKKKEKSYP